MDDLPFKPYKESGTVLNPEKTAVIWIELKFYSDTTLILNSVTIQITIQYDIAS